MGAWVSDSVGGLSLGDAVAVWLCCAALSVTGCGQHKNPTTFLGGPESRRPISSSQGGSSGADPSANGDSGAGDVAQGGEPSVPPLTVGDGAYDPDQVYLFGTLVEARTGVNATALVSAPNLYTVGFPAGIGFVMWKKQLVYVDPKRDG